MFLFIFIDCIHKYPIFRLFFFNTCIYYYYFFFCKLFLMQIKYVCVLHFVDFFVCVFCFCLVMKIIFKTTIYNCMYCCAQTASFLCVCVYLFMYFIYLFSTNHFVIHFSNKIGLIFKLSSYFNFFSAVYIVVINVNYICKLNHAISSIYILFIYDASLDTDLIRFLFTSIRSINFKREK